MQRTSTQLPPPRAFGRREQGTSLIEVLVAAVVLAIGLLGLAGLQLRGMQVNQGSAMRAQAGILAEDLADRMRSDYVAAQSGSFAGTYTLANEGATPVPSLSDWLYGLAALPAGVDATSPCPGGVLPCVNIQNTAGATEIDVYWYDARAVQGASTLIASPDLANRLLAQQQQKWGQYTTVAQL